MSRVKYKVGSKEYFFKTDLQIANLLAVETCLVDEIKDNMRLNNLNGIMHDISIEDENGLIANAKDFSEVGKLKLKMTEL